MTNSEEHIFIIQFENHSDAQAKADPNFSKFAKMGTYLTNYYAVTHPSQPSTFKLCFLADILDYIAQAAGSYFNCHDDNYVTYSPDVHCLADLMEAKQVSWKVACCGIDIWLMMILHSCIKKIILVIASMELSVENTIANITLSLCSKVWVDVYLMFGTDRVRRTT